MTAAAAPAAGAPWPFLPLSFRGRVDVWTIESAALRGNRAGDPHVRELTLYTPPGGEGRELPLIVVLAGYTGRGQGYLETHPWRAGLVLQYERAVLAGQAPPAVLALPDCFTRLGGSQYVNSSFLGRYEDFVADEVVPFAARRATTRADSTGRAGTIPRRFGVVGKSSGGFGALHLAMRRPGLFSAVASVSGDCCFELCYAGGFPTALRALVRHGMDPARFLAAFAERPKPEGDAFELLNLLAMSAAYSPDPESPLGFDLPVELETCERIDAVWRRWLEFDPLQACERHADALRRLELLHVECGLADEYHLQWGLRRLVKKLRALGIACQHEEHEAGHRDIDHRTVAAIGKVAAALSRAR